MKGDRTLVGGSSKTHGNKEPPYLLTPGTARLVALSAPCRNADCSSPSPTRGPSTNVVACESRGKSLAPSNDTPPYMHS